MKRAIFSISEKHERITMRYRRRRKKEITVCESCGQEVDKELIAKKPSSSDKKNLLEKKK